MTDDRATDDRAIDERPEDIFSSAAQYYARYRQPYPAELWQTLVDELALDGTQRVLDLGCGTGHVAVPLSTHVSRVVAVDPQVEMLEAGRAVAAADPTAGTIQWQIGDSTRLSELRLAGLDLVTMGRSFHWMDRTAVLRDLDAMIRPGGAVVLLHTAHPPPDPPTEWRQVIEEIRVRHLGADPPHLSPAAVSSSEQHADVLRASAFSVVTVHDWTHSVIRDLDWVVGLQFSFSCSTPRRFGSRRGAYEDELRKALIRAQPSGSFELGVTTELVLARRP